MSGGSAVEEAQVEYFDRPKIIVSKNQIVVPPKMTFLIFSKELGVNSDSKFLIE